MANTLGYHLVISAYGLWLPGDERGTWSEAWDEQLGFIEPHTLHPGDPVRLRMSRERMTHPRVLLNTEMLLAVEDTIGTCAAQSDWKVVAASIESTHAHLLLTYTKRDIDNTVKWLKDQATKCIHKTTRHRGPVWCKGRWRGFVYDPLAWYNTRHYIEQHNVRRGVDPRPYPFLVVDDGREVQLPSKAESNADEPLGHNHTD
jgi:REP element-mobilizing transposase RayT